MKLTIKAKIQKWGGSNIVVIPSDDVSQGRLTLGQEYTFEVETNGNTSDPRQA